MIVMQTFVTIVALLVASIATLIASQTPRIVLELIDQHGCPLELVEDKYIPLGIDSTSNRINYPLCSPSDWEIIIGNDGRVAVNELVVELSIEGVMFLDKSVIYDVKDFVYGLGCYDTLVFDFNSSIKPGEKIQLPKIPFQYSECGLMERVDMVLLPLKK